MLLYGCEITVMIAGRKVNQISRALMKFRQFLVISLDIYINLKGVLFTIQIFDHALNLHPWRGLSK